MKHIFAIKIRNFGPNSVASSFYAYTCARAHALIFQYSQSKMESNQYLEYDYYLDTRIKI